MAREVLKNARQQAGMTQQQVADLLEIGVRQYQRIESGTSHGTFSIWDKLEDVMGVHQRKLREIAEKYHDQQDSQGKHRKCQQF